MNRLAAIINGMDEQDLRLIQKDIYEGNLSQLIKSRLHSMMPPEESKQVCPVCGSPIDSETARYELIFGPPDLRRRARFDGLDCLRYFIKELEGKKDERTNIRKIYKQK